MIKIRKSEERGKANYGWLNANYSFSFGNYFDPNHTGFRDLLVINQDLIEAGGGFSSHPHRNMEIITYIIEGGLEHKDSLGNIGVINKGEVQRISAGTGIYHSEYNPSKEHQTKLLQIWVQPETKNIPPSYQQIKFEKNDGVKLLVSKNVIENQISVNQDFNLYGVSMKPGQNEQIEIAKNRHIWIQMIKGEVDIDGVSLLEGDGAAISELTTLHFHSKTDSEFLVMDLK